MFIYFATRYTASATGAATKLVTCEKCQCVYQYQLIRRGSGTGSAPYGLGKGAAQRAAQRGAQKQLAKLLAKGVDPSPCPDCGWLQADMVRDILRRQARWLLVIAWLIPVLAALFGLCVWWVASNGGRRPLDESTTQFLVATGMVATVLAAAAVFARRAWITRVNPNRNYPARPDPIPGAAPPVRITGTSGEIPADAVFITPDSPTLPAGDRDPQPTAGTATLAYERRLPHLEPGGWLTVQLLRLRHPDQCCSCLQPTTASQGFRPHIRLRIPFCRSCQRRLLKRTVLLIIAGIVAGGLIPAVLVALATNGNDPATAFAAAAGLVAGGLIGLWLRNALYRPVSYSRFDEQRNTLRFRFRNPAYMDSFAAANDFVR